MKMLCFIFFLCGRSVRGCAIFSLEFCFTYYTVIYVCILYCFFFFCSSISCIFMILYSIMIMISLNFSNFIKNNVISAKFQHSEQYAFEVQAVSLEVSVISPEEYS